MICRVLSVLKVDEWCVGWPGHSDSAAKDRDLDQKGVVLSSNLPNCAARLV
jgi:hypothetical protein